MMSPDYSWLICFIRQLTRHCFTMTLIAKLFNWNLNIYKQAGTHNFGTTRLQIKGWSLILPQQARFHSGCHETTLQANATVEHCATMMDAWFTYVLFANLFPNEAGRYLCSHGGVFGCPPELYQNNNMKSTIFCDITSYNPWKVNRHFEGTYCLHLQGRRMS
jgi:hypothetical protein